MFKSFTTWLDSYISQEGVSAAIKGLAGLLGFAGLLGTVFGSQMIRVGAFVVVAGFMLTGILVLVADRRQLRNAYYIHRDLMARYCDFIIDHHPEPLISVESWNQVVYIQRNGDVREVLKIKAKALRKELYFIKFHAGSEWDQPERYRRKVKIKARSVKVDGVSGPHWHVTHVWLSDRKMSHIVHLNTPVHCDAEIRLEIERIWPGKCRPLMRDHVPESFIFSTTKLLQIQNAEYKVVLPAGYSASYSAIGFEENAIADPAGTAYSITYSITPSRDDEGRKTFTFQVRNLQIFTDIGMQLDLEQPPG